MALPSAARPDIRHAAVLRHTARGLVRRGSATAPYITAADRPQNCVQKPPRFPGNSVCFVAASDYERTADPKSTRWRSRLRPKVSFSPT
jgi:hypothetical protein